MQAWLRAIATRLGFRRAVVSDDMTTREIEEIMAFLREDDGYSSEEPEFAPGM